MRLGSERCSGGQKDRSVPKKKGVGGMGKKMYGRRRAGRLASKNGRWRWICIDSWRTASLEAKIETVK